MSPRFALPALLVPLLLLFRPIPAPAQFGGMGGMGRSTPEDREHAQRIAKLQRELAILQARAALKQAEIQKIEAEYRLRGLEAAIRADEATSQAEPATLKRPLTAEEERAVRNKLTVEDAQRASAPLPDAVIIEFQPADDFVQTGPGKPSRDARTRAVLDALDRPLTMPFPDETPLGEVLKYVKKSTIGDHLPDGIPIYLDPLGLMAVEDGLKTRVALKSEGDPLRESLKTLLGALGLSYRVRDGVLTIAARPRRGDPEEKPE